MLKLKKATQQDKDLLLDYIQMFYKTGATSDEGHINNFKNTINEALNDSPWVEIYLILNVGEPAGYCMLAHTFSNEVGGKVVWIEELYVTPDFQGQGIGKEVIQALYQMYPDAKRFRLEVDPQNTKASALYERLGFEFMPYLEMKVDF